MIIIKQNVVKFYPSLYDVNDYKNETINSNVKITRMIRTEFN